MRRCRLLLLTGVAALAHPQQILSVAGNVSVHAADNAPWTDAAAGMTLAQGTSVSVGPKAMTELRVDPSDSFVAAANSRFKLAGFDNGKYGIELIGGKITYQAADPRADALRVNLPAIALEPAEPGIYTIAHAPGGQSEITVQAGLARVVASSGSER